MFPLVSDNVLRIVLIALNSTYILFGASMIGYGVYHRVMFPQEIDEDSDADDHDIPTIITGCVDIVTGILGLLGVFLVMRLFFVMNVTLLILSSILNVVFIIVLSLGIPKIPKMALGDIKELIMKKYGVNSDPEFKSFTMSIDEYQETDPCCGWTGKEDENIFLLSPWYYEINTGNKLPKPRTLPSSCCLVSGEDCHSTENILLARQKGFVHKEDCITKIIQRSKATMWSSLIQLILTTPFELAGVFFGIMRLAQLVGDD